MAGAELEPMAAELLAARADDAARIGAVPYLYVATRVGTVATSAAQPAPLRSPNASDDMRNRPSPRHRRTTRGDQLAAMILAPVGAVLGAVALVAFPIATADASGRYWSPCENEDGPGRCVWDAEHMGNGEGRSYIVRHNGTIRYVSHDRAHKMLERNGADR